MLLLLQALRTKTAAIRNENEENKDLISENILVNTKLINISLFQEL
jgi:flagellar biosynthesis/type III secretory pathway chaperone